MIDENFDRNISEQILSLISAAQKLVVQIRQSTHQNNTYDISAIRTSDEVDRPEPVRLTDVIIVICVLLLWCGTILIFIRHSELLRIRHRDLPFRSTVKPPISSTHLTIHPRNSEMHRPYSRAHLSSSGGLTPPPIINSVIYEPQLHQQHVEINETRSEKFSSSLKKALQVHSFDFNGSLSNKENSFIHNDKERLLNPSRISVDIKRSLLDLHKKSLDNIYAIIGPTSYSANEISRREEQNNAQLLTKKRCIHESPV